MVGYGFLERAISRLLLTHKWDIFRRSKLWVRPYELTDFPESNVGAGTAIRGRQLACFVAAVRPKAGLYLRVS
jgi:hypothetical protein